MPGRESVNNPAGLNWLARGKAQAARSLAAGIMAGTLGCKSDIFPNTRIVLSAKINSAGLADRSDTVAVLPRSAGTPGGYPAHLPRAQPRFPRLRRTSNLLNLTRAYLRQVRPSNMPRTGRGGGHPAAGLRRFGCFRGMRRLAAVFAAGEQHLQRRHHHKQQDRADEHAAHHDDGERALHLAADGGRESGRE